MSTKLREIKRQRQRDAIVEASVSLFRERGFERTRVQDILDRAEISLGTFYNYFPGKDAVLDEFGTRVIASYVALARDEVDAHESPVAERVRALAVACAKAFSADPGFMTVVVKQSRAFGGRGPLPATEVPIYATLCVLFEEGQSTGEIRGDIAPMELAEAFSGLFIFAVISWLVAWRPGSCDRDDEADLRARVMRAFDIFLGGCLA